MNLLEILLITHWAVVANKTKELLFSIDFDNYSPTHSQVAINSKSVIITGKEFGIPGIPNSYECWKSKCFTSIIS